MSPTLRARLNAATFDAFDRIIDHTIEHNADCLLIAGDIYDSKDRSLRALVQFRRQMERLADRGIPVFIVHGNHDPLNGWGSEFRLPANVTTFGPRIETHPVLRAGEEVARITGASYPKERVTENLASNFRPTLGAPYSIALLHSNVGAQAEHADYAPASLDDLVASGFDYWALGHVHTRSVLTTDPCTVVYPGNPQGRHAKECGIRGCYQVDVDTHGRTHLTFVESQVIRWEAVEVSIAGHGRIETLLDEMHTLGGQLAQQYGAGVVVRWTIAGHGLLHRDLQRDGMDEEIRHHLAEVVPSESVRITTTPELDLVSIRKSEALVGDFLKLCDRAGDDPALLEKLRESLTPLFRRKELGPPTDERLKEWLQRARDLGVDLLLDA